MNVLIVEDHPDDRKLLRYYLSNWGCNVIEAGNGEEALAIARENHPDLIISDALMPVMDGFQFLRTIRHDPDFCKIPFIFYSAVYTDCNDQELALSLGADAFIVKPKEADEFWTELNSILNGCTIRESSSIQTSIQDEEEYLRRYSTVVATKLEEKVRELESANETIRQFNQELENKVCERTTQLENALSELESFSYSVSHDLRAPLRSIDGFSGFLEQEYGDRLDEVGNDYLRRVRGAIGRMEKLIEALLDLSRITRKELHLSEINLSELAREIAADLQKIDPKRRANFSITDGLTVNCDPSLMHLVMENLLGNAWKFTRDRNPAVIEFGTTQINNTTWYFIRDNGAGYSMEYADKLFSPFQRLHSEKEFPGTGIGLATVQRIIRRHGGSIYGESAPGQGATFYFRI